LNAGLCKPAPSHPAKAVASFPCAEDLLDPTTNAVDRLVPGLKARQCFSFVASPHTGGEDARRSTLGAHRVAEMIAAIGTVGKHLTRIIGKRISTGLAVIDVGGRDGDFFHKRRIGVGANMGLEAMNGWFAFVLDPMALFIILAGRGDDRRIDKRAGLHLDRFGLERR